MVYRANSNWSSGIISGCKKISGYTSDELNSEEKNWLKIIHPEDGERIFREGAILAEKKIDLVQVYRIITKNGEIKWVEDRKTSIFSEAGKFLGIEGIVFDITDRKRMEIALKDSETKFRNLVEYSNDFIWEVTTEGIYTYASPQVEKILGYTPNEIVGKLVFDLMPFEESDRIKVIFKKILKKREPIVALENVNQHKDGSLITIETSGLPVFDEAGNVTHYRGVDRDITIRKQAAKKLQESEKFMNSLLENSRTPILVVNPDTSIRYVNPTLTKLTGYSIEELKGQKIPYPWWIEGDSRSGVEKEKKEYMFKGTRRFEKLFRKKDGSEFWVEINTAPVYFDGEIKYSLTQWVDITERKRAEEERNRLVSELRHALSEVRILGGLLPICSSCKKIRDDKGYWNQIESYIRDHSEAEFSHSICPECVKKLYPDLNIYGK